MSRSRASPPRLTYVVRPPPPALAGFVDYVWSLHDAPSHTRESIIPCGTLELVINLHEDEFRIYDPLSSGTQGTRFRGAIASGAYSRAFVGETRAHASIVGVHFRPGGAGPILGVPAGELSDAHVELEALWGRRAVALRDRLCAATHTEACFNVLEEALIDGMAGAPRVRGEIVFALDRLRERDVEVAAVARQLGLSHRRFIELFTEQVGMTPKRYSRVVRFQRALQLVSSHDEPAWTQGALECGYFDQPHLCRDWTEFTGFSPADFLRLRKVRVKDHHVALPQAPATPRDRPAARRTPNA